MSAGPPSPRILEVKPGVHRPGRRFEPSWERELDPALRSLAANLPGAEDGVLVTPEFPGPDGIADLIAVTSFERALAARVSSGLPPLEHLTDSSIVAAVPAGRTVRADSVARTVGMTAAQAERRLRSLAALGFIHPVGSGYRRDPAVAPIGRMYVFEAKVSDWRAAARQALRYGTWADAASIVLLRERPDGDESLAMARSLRLGLAVRDRWLLRPTLHKPLRGPRLLASERLLATVVSEQSSYKPSADA